MRLINNVLKHDIYKSNVSDKTNNEFNIAFGTDDNYARGMAAGILSIIINNPEIKFIFHVFATLNNPANSDRIAQIAQMHDTIINVYQIDDAIFHDLPKTSAYPKSIYLRLIIPEILHDLSRVLYVDSDVICLGDISGLINLDLAESVIAAVHDIGTHVPERIRTLGLVHNKYFNSGVILYDVEKWLKADMFNQLARILTRRKGIFLFPDQDALNIVLDGKVRAIANKWNLLYDMGKMTDDIPENTLLLHFAGHVKPWQSTARHRLVETYLVYDRQSPWANEPLDDPSTKKEMRLDSKLLLKNAGILTPDNKLKNDITQEEFQFIEDTFNANSDDSVLQQVYILTLKIQGIVLHNQGEFREAAVRLRKCLAVSPDSPELLYILGCSLYSANDHEEAIQAWKNAVELRANFIEPLTVLTEALCRQERFDEALMYAQQALAVQPDNLSLIKAMAFILYGQGRYQESLDYYSRALEIAPDSAELRADYGQVLLRLENLEKGFKEKE